MVSTIATLLIRILAGRTRLSFAALALAVVVFAAPLDAAGPYPVPEVVLIEFTLPPTVLTSGTQNFECLARTDYSSGTTVPARTICYNTAAPGTPVPPTSYHAVDHSEFNGILFPDGEFFAAVIPCLYFPQLTPPTALRITMDAVLDKGAGPVTGSVTVIQNTDDAPVIYCADGTESTGPLTLTPLADDHNTDADVQAGYPAGFDSCPDWNELGDDPARGGLRDPFNPYDFYDVSGDGYVALTTDILPVVTRWTPNPTEPYDAIYDRGATIGPNSWNKAGPDGQISLTFDILGVILQWQHDCT